MIFSCSWNFPKPDRLSMREAVFSFFSKHGAGENTEAEMWKQLIQTTGESCSVADTLVNAGPGMFHGLSWTL